MSSPSPNHEELCSSPPEDPPKYSLCSGPVHDQMDEEEPSGTESTGESPTTRMRHLELNRRAAARCRENKKRHTRIIRAREKLSRQQRIELREDVLCMRETIMEYQTLLMKHKDCPQYQDRDGFCVHQILASIERFKGVFDYIHDDANIRLLRAELLGESNVQVLPIPPPGPPIACDCKPYCINSEDRPKQIAG